MNQIKSVLRNQLYRTIYWLSDLLSIHGFYHLLATMLSRRVRFMEPDEGLRFLFKLDAHMYPMKGQFAIAYGGGLHTKHRHIKYHDFFLHRIQDGEHILDIGCGNGALAYDIAEKAGASVVGIDQNLEMIHQARQCYAHPQIEYHIGDVLETLPQRNFDTIILSNVLEHLPNRPKFLQKLQSSIAPFRFLIRVPLFERDWQVPLKQELGVEWRLDPTHKTEYTVESFADEIAEAHLHIVYQEIHWGEIWAEVVSDVE